LAQIKILVVVDASRGTCALKCEADGGRAVPPLEAALHLSRAATTLIRDELGAGNLVLPIAGGLDLKRTS
jgi:hypothetical protein